MAKKNLTRTIKFTTRLNERERKHLNKIAKRNQMTPSEIVRKLVASIA